MVEFFVCVHCLSAYFRYYGASPFASGSNTVRQHILFTPNGTGRRPLVEVLTRGAERENYKRVRFLQQNNLQANDAAASVEIWMLVGWEETIPFHRHALGSDLN